MQRASEMLAFLFVMRFAANLMRISFV